MNTETTIVEKTPLENSLNRQKTELYELEMLIVELRIRLCSILQEEDTQDCEENIDVEPVKLIAIIDRNSNQINKGYQELKQIIRELTI